MRVTLCVLAFVTLTGCSREELVQTFSSPEDRASALRYLDALRAGDIDKIEKALDPGIRNPDTRSTLLKMKAMIPGGEPTSVKLVGSNIRRSSDARTVNSTFEYEFGDKWMLANVAIVDRGGARSIIGINVYPRTESLDSEHRFRLAGKGAVHYAMLAAMIAVVLITLYSLVECVRTKPLGRRWLWVLFILVGVGSVAINWTTGEWGTALFVVQLFGAGFVAAPYGPWTLAVSFPLGAIAFLLYKRTRARAGAPD